VTIAVISAARQREFSCEVKYRRKSAPAVDIKTRFSKSENADPVFSPYEVQTPFGLFWGSSPEK